MKTKNPSNVTKIRRLVDQDIFNVIEEINKRVTEKARIPFIACLGSRLHGLYEIRKILERLECSNKRELTPEAIKKIRKILNRKFIFSISLINFLKTLNV